MRKNEYSSRALEVLLVPLLLILLSVAGCAGLKPSVVAIDNQEVAALDAEDIARVMLKAGFDDEQILELGTDLRNRLARSGAAQINEGSAVQAIFAVDGGYVYVTSRLNGSFIYDLSAKRPTDRGS